jgi:hypothetical protein
MQWPIDFSAIVLLEVGLEVNSSLNGEELLADLERISESS